MAWSQSDLDAIKAAIANGAKRVKFQTHEVEYMSLTEMLKARDLIQAELSGSSANSGGAIFAQYDGGY